MKTRWIAPLLVLIAVLIAGCSPAAPVPAVADVVLEPAGLAQVQSVEILADPNAPAVLVIASGKLTDECDRLGEAQVNRGDGSVEIRLEVSRYQRPDCSGTAEDFQRVVRLNRAELAAGEWSVKVNDQAASFSIQSEAAAPTSAPTEAPAETTPAATPDTSTQPPAAADVAASPAPEPTQAAAVPVSGDSCENKAAFFADVTIPDNTVMEPGEAFTKTWRIRNEGTCTWGSDYALVFESGEAMTTEKRVKLPAVKPGEIVDLSVKMTAPTGIGSYTSSWEFESPQGNRFGVNSQGIDTIWVTIITNAGAPPPVPPGDTASCAFQPNNDYIQTILASINAERAGRGLASLTLDNRLSAAAQGHSVDMACNDFVDHYGYNGSTWYDRIAGQGYSYGSASENIYAGNPAFGGDANGAFVWWMNSQIHRDAILNAKFTAFGIGYAYRPESTYDGYYTVVFARPK